MKNEIRGAAGRTAQTVRDGWDARDNRPSD